MLQFKIIIAINEVNLDDFLELLEEDECVAVYYIYADSDGKNKVCTCCRVDNCKTCATGGLLCAGTAGSVCDIYEDYYLIQNKQRLQCNWNQILKNKKKRIYQKVFLVIIKKKNVNFEWTMMITFTLHSLRQFETKLFISK